MNKKQKYCLLAISTFCIIIFNSCQKEEKLFAHHIVGHVSDYFDGTDLEGVKVGLVYSYYPPNSFGPYVYTPAPGVTEPPCADVELLVTTTTDKYGEFSINYHPLKKLDNCYGGYDFNYYLIFEKEGSGYFLQSEIINTTKKLRKKFEYKMRPYIQVDFNISNTKPTTPVKGSVRVYGSPLYYDNIIINGTNINSTYTIGAKWTETIGPGCSIVDSTNTFIYYYSFQETFIPTKKYYSYDIIY